MEASHILLIFITTFIFLIYRKKTLGKIAQLNFDMKAERDRHESETDRLKTKIKNFEDRLPDLEKKAESYDHLGNCEEQIKDKKNEIESLNNTLVDIKKMIDPYQQHIDLIESGFFRYKFKFEDVDKYSEALLVLKEAQKTLIRSAQAVIIDVKELEGSAIYKSISKIALNAFNSEVEAVMKRVNYNNYDSCSARIIKTFDTINKHLSACNMKITKAYLDTKVKEMTLAFEYEEEKQRIKEEQAEILAQMREEEAARAEAEKAREKAIQEEEMYEKALEDAQKEIEGKSEEEKSELMKKILELQGKLDEAHKERERATSMAQITKAGHVYVISNLGSFGENVYKIGMTRRKEPLDRVKELGDASVPFKFDVHAMIYSENAPELENMLHKKFNDMRLNKVNHRKEFFNVKIEDVEKICFELGYKFKFTKAAEAREYHESLDYDDVKEAS